ncbi:MAG: SUMF1/EgtB/PvdO family nonheme iron enzyme, partial [Candidatus Hydrogenedentes bacterium]|nr:SUMF1/EgtB/PvdO family nonheme iron enzyme [Candidatus Hydrogenedentota bacterium]
CHDWYDSGYYAVSPAADPEGPASGSDRVYRGGSWRNPEDSCRSARRAGFLPSVLDFSIGFRLAR